ncbi:MAG: hypothetical protein ABI321_20960 [Polyangia bacterium]
MLLLAALHTVPLALCLPLPGLLARLAFGLVLASFGGAHDTSPLHAIVSGLGLGLMVLAPVWAARWAGAIVGKAVRTPALDGIYTTLAWLAFFAVGGPVLLMCASALPTDGFAMHGARFVELAASLALPTLLALAILEVLAAVANRWELAAETPLQAHRVTRSLRPLVASLLLLGGLASFAHGVGQSVAEAGRSGVLP